MNRTRTSSLDAFGLRDQRNRIYPTMEGSDGSTLSLDFTAMSSLDSRFTFSRSTQGTFINSSGYVAWSDVNLVRDSIGFAVTSATSRGWGLPAGSTTSLVTDRNGVASNASRTSYTQSGSVSVTWSPDSSAAAATGVVARFWVRGVTNASRIDVGWYQSTLGWGSASDGSCTIVSGYSSGVTITSQSGVLFKVENLSTTQWTQLEVKRSTRFDYLAMYLGGASATGLTHAFEFSDFQVNLGTVAKPFVATSNAANAGLQAPRFTYDPVTLQPLGLLIEASATNLLCWSESFQTTGGANNWTFNGGPTVDRTATSPRNDATATRITSTSGSAHVISDVFASATRTFSIWVRRVSGTGNIRYTLDGTSNWTTFTITSTWTRYSWTGTSTRVGIEISTNGSSGDSIEIWGAQLEAGSGASSYISTGASTVLRDADQCFIADASPFQVSTTNGTLYWRGIIHKQSPAGYTQIVGFMDASVPTFEVYTNNLVVGVVARGSGLNAGGQNEITRTYPLNAQTRYACSIDTINNPIVAAVLNGGAVGTNNKSGTGNLYASTRFVLGRQPTSSYANALPCMTFAEVKYWPVTKTQTELNLLTTT